MNEMVSLEAQRLNREGVAHNSRKEFMAALHKFNQAIALDRSFERAYTNRGYTFRNMNLIHQAIVSLNQAIMIDPTVSSAFNNRGFAYSKLQQFDRALQDYDQAIALDPHNKSALNNRGFLRLRLLQFDQALQDYDRAIALHPTDDGLYHSRGVVFVKMHQLDRALQDFDRALALAPNANTYHYRADTLATLNRLDLALQYYNLGINLAPTDAVAINNRGNTLLKLRRFDEAIEDFRRVTTLEPASGAGWLGLGLVYARIPNHRDEALAAFERSIALLTAEIESPAASDWMWMYRSRARRELAILEPDPTARRTLLELATADSDQVLSQYTSYVSGRLERGLVRVATGSINEAIEDFAIVIATIPQRTFARACASLPRE